VSCEPLLYRDIVVQNAAELEEWAMRYLQLEVVGAQSSTWTRSLSVSAKWGGALTSALLLLLPRLGSLHAACLSQHPVPAPVFDALVKYTQPTLAFLSLHVAFAADAPAPRLHLLDGFAALRTLALHLSAGPARAGSVQGLELPTLTTLHLTLAAGAPLQLLARSRFAALSALTLDAPALRRHDAAQLAPFLAAHPALRTAALHVHDSTLAQLVAGGLRAARVVLDGVPPPAVLGTALDRACPRRARALPHARRGGCAAACGDRAAQRAPPVVVGGPCAPGDGGRGHGRAARAGGRSERAARAPRRAARGRGRPARAGDVGRVRVNAGIMHQIARMAVTVSVLPF
jgi:hypothetical protein